MKHYIKYEFDTLPEILTDKENPIANAAVVIVGKLTITEGTYDEEGNVITAPVLSDKIAVDIIYQGEPLSELEAFRVTPEIPKHTIAGMEDLYYSSL